MNTQTTNLLRRTLVSLGAALALATGTQVLAQGTVTLSGTSGNSCNYNQMTVTPNGNIQVNCGNATPGIATFALSHSSGSSGYLLAPNTSSSATVSRTGGPSEAIMVAFSVSGTGCSSNSGGIMLNAGTSQTIPFSVGAAGTNCIVTIGATGHTTSPNQITFIAQSGTNPNPNPNPTPAPGDCPAVPSTSVAGKTTINDFQQVDHRVGSPASGAILYYPVPASITGSVKVTFDQGQTGSTPPGTTEYQVSPCPGVWDPPGFSIASQCKMGPIGQPNNVFTIWTAPATSAQGTNVQGQSDLQYLCYAPVATRTYYVNVRWTYTCPQEIISGYGGCGYSIKWRSNNTNGLYD